MRKEWKGKWNYAPEFVGDVDDKIRSEFLLPLFINSRNIESDPWSDFEVKAIDVILNKSKALMIKNDILSVNVSNEQIIILTPFNYKEKFKDKFYEECFAFSEMGIIYLMRRNHKDRWMFVKDFCHELSHLQSFYSLRVDSEKKNGLIDVYQTGLAKKNIDDSFSFKGLNEAVSEMWSKCIISSLVDEPLLFKNELEEAMISTMYISQILLIEEIIHNLINNDNLFNILFKSYFFGSSHFIDFIENQIPGISEKLMNMGKSRESALKTAYNIGGEELEDRIDL